MLRGRVFRVLSTMLLTVAALTLAVGAAPQRAMAGSIYTATATPYYQNPITGEVEDSGGAEQMALGQSMVESATYPYALVEYDDAGNAFVTVRLQLASHISGEAFDYDSSWSNQFYQASPTLVQEGDDTADFRFQVDNGSYLPVIRVRMYVADMGRDVVFFITLDNLVEGNAYGFVESVSTGDASAGTVEGTDGSEEATETGSAAAPAATPSAGAPATPTEGGKAAAPAQANPQVAQPTAETATPQAGSDDTQYADGIAEFDEDGNAVDDAGDQGVSVPTVAAVIVGALVVVAALGVVGYLVFVRPKREALADAASKAATLPTLSDEDLKAAIRAVLDERGQDAPASADANASPEASAPSDDADAPDRTVRLSRPQDRGSHDA